MQPVLSIRTMRFQRKQLKQQIYSLSILACTKHNELNQELECFLSDRSFMDLDLNKAMALLVELTQLKEQVQIVSTQFTFFHDQIKRQGAK